MEMLRLYADEKGESHFDEVPVSLALKDDSPPAKPHYFTEPVSASSYVHLRCPVGWDGQLHPTPRRQIIICTSGSVRITTSLGVIRDLAPGGAALLEDTKGKGHISEVISAVPFEAVIIRLE